MSDAWARAITVCRTEDWPHSSLLPVVEAAAVEPTFRRYTPFFRMAGLCLSRTETPPYTPDLPCIEVDREGRFYVNAVAYGPCTTLGETLDPLEAVRTIVSVLTGAGGAAEEPASE